MRPPRSTTSLALLMAVLGACTAPDVLEQADWTIVGAAFFSEVRGETPAPTAVGGIQRFRVRDENGRSLDGLSFRSTQGIFVANEETRGADVALRAVGAGTDSIIVETETQTASFELEAVEATGLFVVPSMADSGLPVEGEDYAVFEGSPWVRAHLQGDDGQALVDESLELIINGSLQEGVSVAEYWDIHSLSVLAGDNIASAVGHEDLSTTITGASSIDTIEAVDFVARIAVGESVYLTFRALNEGRPVLSVPWDLSVSSELTALSLDTGLCPCHSDSVAVEGATTGSGTVTVSVGEFSQSFDIRVE